MPYSRSIKSLAKNLIPFFFAFTFIVCTTFAQTTGTPTPTPPSGGSSTPTATSCPAAFGVYGSVTASASAGATPSSTPTVSVQQTNAPAGGGAGTPANGGSKGQPSASIRIGSIKLNPQINAFDVAAALSGKITGVTFAPVGSSIVLYTLDTTKVGSTTAHPSSGNPLVFSVRLSDVTGRIKPITAKVRLQLDPPGSDPKAGAGEKLKKQTGTSLDIITLQLPDAVQGTNYQAVLRHSPTTTKVEWSKGADFPAWLSLAKDGALSGTAPDPPNIEQQIQTLINGLSPVNARLAVIKLPDGFGHACDIITAIGHQVPQVVSLSVIDDSRILAGISESDYDGTFSSLKQLVTHLALSSISPAPHVSSVTTQLFYDRDAVSIANAISQAFPQLKVAPISSDPSSAYADSVILADPTGGTLRKDGALEQARRMIAQIDQPRPQITVNAWSLQLSSEKEKRMRLLVPEARRFAAGYNDALEKAVARGWDYLNSKVVEPAYLDPIFAGYICNRGEFNPGHGFSLTHPPRQAGCPAPDGLGYGLGYGDIFDRESPNLVQMMLLVMATTDPATEANTTINHMEGQRDDEKCLSTDREQNEECVIKIASKARTSSEDGAQIAGRPEEQQDEKRCLFTRRDQRGKCIEITDTNSCQEVDEWFYWRQSQCLDRGTDCNGNIDNGEGEYSQDVGPLFQETKKRRPPRFIAFACTRERLKFLLPKTDPKARTTTYIGQFRAAVADFLFQNKMKAEYPDDFQPYLFPASAAKLDTVLTPIIEAFNLDMQALQQHLQTQLTVRVPDDKHLSYTSNGLVTVSVVSGNQASVQTQSLNYFPQNPTIKLQDFATALIAGASGNENGGSGGNGGGGNNGGGSNGGGGNSGGGGGNSGPSPAPTPLLTGNLFGVARALAAYGAAQPAQVTAKVGSGLSMTVTPYALSGDSGAELNVNVTYNENAAATISANAAAAQGNDDLNSRVSMHEVSTLVRMDALKFFEVSTMQSVIARQKAPYKILDPIVELPLFDGLGVFPNWRRKPQVIYNQSVIFLQAAILPTAADLGNSVRIQYDLVTSPKRAGSSAVHCYTKEARSAVDLQTAEEARDQSCKAAQSNDKGQGSATEQGNVLGRLMEYHRQMVRYFAGSQPGKPIKETCSGTEDNCLPQWKDIPILSLDSDSDFEFPDPEKPSAKSQSDRQKK